MKKIKHKLILAMVGLCSLMALVLGGYSIWTEIINKEFTVKEYRQLLNEQFDRTIRLETETAVGMVNSIYRQQQQGLFTEEQAKQHAARVLRELRFNNDAYFWVDTVQGTNVVLLGGSTEGRNRINDKDTNGKFYIQEIIQNGINDGGGYTDYWFPKPNEQQSTPKRGYSLLFKPYNWVIGTGNWVDDIEKLVIAKEEVYKQAMIKKIIFTSGLVLLILIGAAMVASYLSRKISDPIIEMSSVVKEIAMGDLRNTVTIDSEDEIGELGKAVNTMTSDLRALISRVATSVEQVAASSEELTATADQSAQASNQVAVSITDVAGRANGQVALVDSAVAAFEIISKELQQFVKNAVIISETATKTEKATNDSEISLAKAISQVNAIANKTSDTAKMIAELEEISKQIAQFAGEATAIAQDKKGESQVSAKEVSALIIQMQQKTAHVVQIMNENKKEVITGFESISLAGNKFREITQMIKEMTVQIYDQSVSTKQIARESENVLNVVLGIDEESKKIAEQTETVSAATEEQSASMEEIASASQALADLSCDLNEGISKFKV